MGRSVAKHNGVWPTKLEGVIESEGKLNQTASKRVPCNDGVGGNCISVRHLMERVAFVLVVDL